MDDIFGQVWSEVQDRIEDCVRLNLLSRNIEPTRERVEDELDRHMLILVTNLCKLAISYK